MDMVNTDAASALPCFLSASRRRTQQTAAAARRAATPDVLAFG